LIAVIPHPWTDRAGAAWQMSGEGHRRLVGDYLSEGDWHTEGPARSGRSLGITERSRRA
jgi:hypothetical protein